MWKSISRESILRQPVWQSFCNEEYSWLTYDAAYRKSSVYGVHRSMLHAASVTGIISKKSSEEPYTSSYWGRIYQCTQCSKAFTHKKQTFFTHMRIHTGENHTNAATVMWHLQKGLVLNHTWELILDRSHSIVSNKWRETY